MIKYVLDATTINSAAHLIASGIGSIKIISALTVVTAANKPNNSVEGKSRITMGFAKTGFTFPT